MTEKRVEHTVSIGNVFDTFDEAVAFRKKVKHPHLYGVYGMWQSEKKQLWVIMPMVALEVLSNFREESNGS